MTDNSLKPINIRLNKEKISQRQRVKDWLTTKTKKDTVKTKINIALIFGRDSANKCNNQAVKWESRLSI